MAGRDTNIGAKRARETREALGLDESSPIQDLLSLTEELLAIPVNVVAMPEGVEGLCWQLDRQVVLWVNAHELLSRRRFTLAHELGHVRCRHGAALHLETLTTLSGRTTTNLEVQANAFAAELLLPAAGIRATLDGRRPSFDVAIELAAVYGISSLAAAYRLVTLGLCDRTIVTEAEAREETVVASGSLEATTTADGLALPRDDLPRISTLLSGQGLAALLDGDATVDDVARRTGVAAHMLRLGLALIG